MRKQAFFNRFEGTPGSFNFLSEFGDIVAAGTRLVKGNVGTMEVRLHPRTAGHHKHQPSKAKHTKVESDTRDGVTKRADRTDLGGSCCEYSEYGGRVHSDGSVTYWAPDYNAPWAVASRQSMMDAMYARARELDSMGVPHRI